MYDFAEHIVKNESFTDILYNIFQLKWLKFNNG